MAAGTVLRLGAVGNSPASSQLNGVQITVDYRDNSLTGGAPGIMTYGNATADNWAGGGGGFQVGYTAQTEWDEVVRRDFRERWIRSADLAGLVPD